MLKIRIPFAGILLFIILSLAANANADPYVIYKDPKQLIPLRIRDLMKRMTLEEKVGQMVQIERATATPEIMKEFSIGSVLSGGGSVPFPQATPQDWINMVNAFQNGSLSSRLEIPMLYGIDAVHGNNNVYNATIFPHNIGLGATRQVQIQDPDLVKRIGAATALEVIVTGNPYVTGNKNVAATAKHFVGDGGTVDGINANNTIIDWHGLLKIHIPGYFSSIVEGVSSIMISYSSLNGVKKHANKPLITDYLKNRLKFKYARPGLCGHKMRADRRVGQAGGDAALDDLDRCPRGSMVAWNARAGRG
ncbi:Lysosomal beta glucosidase-like protein [Drosera capensis]